MHCIYLYTFHSTCQDSLVHSYSTFIDFDGIRKSRKQEIQIDICQKICAGNPRVDLKPICKNIYSSYGVILEGIWLLKLWMKMDPPSYEHQQPLSTLKTHTQKNVTKMT